MRNFLYLIIMTFLIQNAYTQSPGSCEEMGKVVVIIHSNMNRDSLERIKREVNFKGIDFKYSNCKFDKENHLQSIKFSVSCKGCKIHGSSSIGKNAFRRFDGKSGFMINHGGKPSFSIGADISEDI